MKKYDLDKILTSLGTVIMAFPLGVFTYLGIYTRYWADDYCYGALLNQYGFWKVQSFYLDLTPYAQNRYALTFFSGLMEPLGVTGMQILPGATILIWVFVLVYFIRQFGRLLRSDISFLSALFTAEIITAFTLYLAPNQFQILFWRSGLLPYTAPLIGLTLLCAFLFQLVQQESAAWWHWPAVILIAFFTGGFSEIGAALQLSVLFILLLVLVFITRRQGRFNARANKLVLASIYAAAAALVLVIISPANYIRQSGYGEPAGMMTLVAKTLEFSFDFIWLSIRGLPLPFTVLAGLLFISGYRFSKKDKVNSKLPWRSLLAQIGFVVLVCFILILVCFAPSAYIEKNPPAERAQLLPLYILLLSISLICWLIGKSSAILVQKTGLKWTYWLLMMVFLLLQIYPLRMANKTYEGLHQFQKRADVWDTRTDHIIEARENGVMSVDIRQIDSYYMGSIAELLPDPGYWINGCAASYFGVKELKATIPW